MRNKKGMGMILVWLLGILFLVALVVIIWLGVKEGFQIILHTDFVQGIIGFFKWFINIFK